MHVISAYYEITETSKDLWKRSKLKFLYCLDCTVSLSYSQKNQKAQSEARLQKLRTYEILCTRED